MKTQKYTVYSHKKIYLHGHRLHTSSVNVWVTTQANQKPHRRIRYLYTSGMKPVSHGSLMGCRVMTRALRILITLQQVLIMQPVFGSFCYPLVM